MNKKCMTGLVRFGAISTLMFIAAVLLLTNLVSVSAAHSSTITVTPSVVPAASNIAFNAHVESTAGPHSIHEFRVYEPPEFDNLVCDIVDNWEDPVYGYTVIDDTRYYYCQWNAESGYEIDPGESKDFTFSLDTPETECCRKLFVETRDPHGFYAFHEPDLCVDTTPPLTTKSFEGPQKKEDGVEWIDGVTEIVLESTDCPGGCDRDQGPHDAGIDKILYLNILAEEYDLGEEPCWNPDACRPMFLSPPIECVLEVEEFCDEYWEHLPDGGEGWPSWADCVEEGIDEECFGGDAPFQWQVYEGPFQKEEESCHILEYYSIDNVGNVEDVQVNCFFVDKTAPEVTKDIGEPEEEGYDPDAFPLTNGVFHWVTPDTDIAFTCDDSWLGDAPHPSGDEELCFKVSYDEDPDGYNTDEYCRKYQGTMIEGDWCCVPAEPRAPFVFNFNEDEDSVHDLEYFCRDAVDKASEPEIQYYKVDSTPPTITKEMIGNYYGDCPPVGEEDVCYVADDRSSGVAITVEDGGQICAVDEVVCTYEVWWEGDIIDSGQFSEYQEIIFDEDSTHELIIHCEDALGNKVDDVEIFLVDSTPPETIKIYGEPYKYDPICWERVVRECQGNNECIYERTHAECTWWINSSTTVTLMSEDEKVGVDKIYWRNLYFPENDEICHLSTGRGDLRVPFCHPGYYTQFVPDYGELPWNEYVRPFYKEEESCHVIEYFAVDRLGNEEFMHWQCVFVDNTPPESEKEHGQPLIPDDGFDWVTHDTSITLDCIDAEPHPVEQETLCYKVSFDDPQRPYLTREYCAEYGGEMEDDWCCVYVGDGGEYELNFMEDSEHDLEYFCIDHLGNKEEAEIQYYKVDTEPPIITKEMIGERHLGDCPPVGEEDVCYVADDGENGVEITVVDGGAVCAVDEVECHYELWWETSPDDCDDAGGGYYGEGRCLIDNDFFSESARVIFEEDSTHVLYIECIDALGNYVEDEETFLVDSTPPETEKEYGEPTKVEEGYRWITSSTEITLEADDEKAGVDEINYRVTLLEIDDEDCYEECGEVSGSGDWVSVPDDNAEFTIPEESCHLIEFYSVDELGNEEEREWQCVFVDNSPPESEKEHGEPLVPDDGFDWVTEDTEITLWCEDPEPHPVDQETLCYKVSLDDDELEYLTDDYCEEFGGRMEEGWCCVYLGGEEYGLNFLEDSNHNLEYFCRDHLGNTEEPEIQWYKVDSEPPEVTKIVEGPQFGECPPGPLPLPQDQCYVDSATRIRVETEDGGEICHIDGVECRWRYRVNDGEWSDWNSTFPINFPEESYHTLELECWDALGNTWSDTEMFIVDKTPPVLIKEVGEPNIPCEELRDPECDYWVRDHVTEIFLDCEDQEPHPSGHTTLYYRYNIDGGEWISYESQEPVNLVFEEDSVHTLEAWCVDAVEKESEHDVEIFKVDSTPPTTTKTYIGPLYEEDGVEWIDGVTNISLEAEDGGEICAVGGVTTHYRYTRVSDDMCWEECEFDDRPELISMWNTYTGPFSIPEESCHLIEFYSEDALGNEEELQYQCVFVDKTKPVTTKWFEGPQYMLGGEFEPSAECINSCESECSILNDDCVPECIEEECREPFDECVEECEDEYDDDVDGIINCIETECSEYGTMNIKKWINSGTLVYLEAEDVGPHPSGLQATYWRNTLVDDVNCEDRQLCLEAEGEGEWNEYDAPFNKEEESCHLIEYYSVDNVEKTEVVKKQCVYVDNTPPEPNKEVGEPKTKWDGKDAIYYNISHLCWNGQEDEIECWKTTLLTPITLGCVDPEPHPVDHEGVCFKVEWDGDDMTEDYCDDYDDGDYNETSGFCCIEEETEFMFDKISEHELEYYCYDALGNEGPIDIEKFKVEKTAFEIQINKKWNLISVPVFLLDDSMEVIFANLSDCVRTVWTYNAVTDEWYVFTPDGNNMNDNLNTMLPGWGYWILADDDCTMLIGGSLMRPGPTGQAKKEIVPGWNLIGYYGAEGMEGYYGPDGNGGEAYCELYSLGDSIWDKEFTSLWTYWEPDNPYQWSEYDRYDNMDPGAGYWLATPEEGLYTISTACDD